MRKLLIAYGTRPEWIKIKPLISKLNEAGIEHVLLFTGQHVQDTIDFPYSVRLIIDNYKQNRLNLIVNSILYYDLFNLDDVKGTTHVLVQGDTSSAFAVALSAFHHKIPVIHLEAGLRTYDMKNPYPEEFNRRAIALIADLNLCPTVSDRKNLDKENVPGSKYIVGNTVLDNLVGKEVTYNNDVIITMHRRENLEILPQWFNEFSILAKAYPQYNFIIPLHPNPEVQKWSRLLDGIKIESPWDHETMVDKICKCRMIISDSGGLQEEASFLKKKILVCRTSTERLDSLNETSFLCKHPHELLSLFRLHDSHPIPEDHICPYGNGHSSEMIVDILKKHYGF